MLKKTIFILSAIALFTDNINAARRKNDTDGIGASFFTLATLGAGFGVLSHAFAKAAKETSALPLTTYVEPGYLTYTGNLSLSATSLNTLSYVAAAVAVPCVLGAGYYAKQLYDQRNSTQRR